jgi:signal transduction histidine kinase
MSLRTIGLAALTLLLCSVIVLRSVEERTVSSARESAKAQLGYLSDAFLIATDWEAADALSERAQKSRWQYLFRRLDRGEAQRQLLYAGETLYNSGTLALDRVLGAEDERLIEVQGRYGVAVRRTVENGCTVCLLYDCTDQIHGLDSLRRTLLSVGAIAFVLLTAAALLLTTAALSPLRELERAARRMAGGDYETPIPARHPDEVGSLANSFETMRRAVQNHLMELSEVAEERKLLLGALTHEMKTPMTAIVGYSEALNTLRLSKEQREECVRYLHRESRRLERLTQKMMRLITLDGGEPIALLPLTGEELLRVLDPMLGPIAANNGTALSMDLDAFITEGDLDLMCSVIVNLFDNAVSAGAKHVGIFGTANAVPVRDDGAGMEPEVLARVTEPFYRADKARSRTGGHAGLGLALVKRIVALHDGALSFVSAPGKGTTVTVRLHVPKEERV